MPYGRGERIGDYEIVDVLGGGMGAMQNRLDHGPMLTGRNM